MARSLALTFVIVASLAVAASTSKAYAQGFLARFQPVSPSDRPSAELLPPQPTLPISPEMHQPAQQSFIVQKPYAVQKATVCCPDYCVTYHHHGLFRRSCCGHCSPTTIMLAVPDPIRCGCAAQVCVTIPSCCTGAPCVTSKVGLFGRGIVIYQWASGYKVEVIFKKLEPHVMVHSFAR